VVENVLPIDMHGLPKLEDRPCRGVLKRIRVSSHQVNRHPDFTISRVKYQHCDKVQNSLQQVDAGGSFCCFCIESVFQKSTKMAKRRDTYKYHFKLNFRGY